MKDILYFAGLLACGVIWVAVCYLLGLPLIINFVGGAVIGYFYRRLVPYWRIK